MKYEKYLDLKNVTFPHNYSTVVPVKTGKDKSDSQSMTLQLFMFS